MRLVHMIHSLNITAVVLLGLTAAVPAMALTIESPTEGRTVRDQVAIVIPRSSLPSGVARSGFLAVKIDGRFCAAISIVDHSGEKAPASENIVYIWNTKSPIDDPLLPKDERRYRDGRHEIVVEAHTTGAKKKEDVAATAKVNVVLQNSVPRPQPAPSLHLRYRYHLGQQSLFRISAAGEILDNNGYSMTGGQPPILGEFDVMQSIEDVKSDGSALIRYKVQKNAFTQVFGQISLLGQQGQSFKSVYKILDSVGRTIEANVLSTKSEFEVTDCLVRLPSHPVQVGDTWFTSTRLKLEGLATQPADLTGESKIEALEWEGGFKCAKIVSRLNGSMSFSFLPQAANTPVAATSVAYFAYESGKLVNETITFEFGTSLDNSFLATLAPQAIPTQSAAAPSAGAPAPGMPPVMMPGMGMPPPSDASPGRLSTSTPQNTMTPVKVRLVVAKELKAR